MEQKYFITAAEVAIHTDVQKNVDSPYFAPRLARVQEDVIKPLLGAALYEELLAAFLAKQQEVPVPMPENLAQLHAQLAPVMAQYVFLRSLPHMVVKATNRGLKPAGELDLSDAQYRRYRDAVEVEAQSRSRDFTEWLEARKADYPNYKAAALEGRPIGGIVL
ncbi:DUF6712 family protein [Pontibacter mangrovi]|uniref:Uncharacterized protein n=1 Tax=Pontibacter mangrovi TaxID=2589816 RepID=A0A501W8S4_9BACT|nr:hypothetical protein [Pontibacter mangrovi]TPE44925.1 hypothetical protein FJM65_07885 [Pontibacter mangrovi]